MVATGAALIPAHRVNNPFNIETHLKILVASRYRSLHHGSSMEVMITPLLLEV